MPIVPAGGEGGFSGGAVERRGGEGKDCKKGGDGHMTAGLGREG